MTTLFEKIKESKKTDYQAAYKTALDNAYQVKQHEGHVTVYSVTGEYIQFESSKL